MLNPYLACDRICPSVCVPTAKVRTVTVSICFSGGCYPRATLVSPARSVSLRCCFTKCLLVCQLQPPFPYHRLRNDWHPWLNHLKQSFCFDSHQHFQLFKSDPALRAAQTFDTCVQTKCVFFFLNTVSDKVTKRSREKSLIESFKRLKRLWFRI